MPDPQDMKSGGSTLPPPPRGNHPYDDGCLGKEMGWGVFEGAESIFLGCLPKNLG